MTVKLRKNYKYVWANLSRLNIKGILQGDFLFTDDLKSINIDGEKMISFTPNTITYAVPVDSDLGKRIARAKMVLYFIHHILVKLWINYLLVLVPSEVHQIEIYF